MKKIKLKKKIRLTIMILLLISIIITTFLLIKEIRYPQVIEETKSVYSYTIQPNITYEVFLRPNILFDKASMDEGKVYLNEYVDHVKATFNYNFHGEEVSNISGDYDVIGVMEGYSGEGDNYKVIWQKYYTLVPSKSFNVNDKTLVINEDISLNIKDYNDFALQVIEDSKTSLNVKFTAIMNVNLHVNSDKGSIDENVSPSIIIPLRTGFFEITKLNIDEKQGNIEETFQEVLPLNKKNVIIYSLLIAMFIVSFIFILFFTTIVTDIDYFNKELKKIFKEHGNRLVALNNEVETSDKLYSVRSIEDLVRLADEIGQPITYKYSLYERDINKFYVYNGNQVYVFDLINWLKESNDSYYSQQGETHDF